MTKQFGGNYELFKKYIEMENLCRDGTALVYKETTVNGNAVIGGAAVVCDGAVIPDKAFARGETNTHSRVVV